MYTVIRLQSSTDINPELLIEKIHSLAPTSDAKPGRRLRYIALTASSAQNWSDHCEEINKILHALEPLLKEWIQKNNRATVDSAIEIDDYAGRWLTSYEYPPHIVAKLASLGLSLCISLYGVQNSE